MSKSILRETILAKLNVYSQSPKDIEVVWLQNTIKSIDDNTDNLVGMFCRVWTKEHIYTFNKVNNHIICDVTARKLPEIGQSYHRYIDL